eukprot:TRINITY_DN11984_c0_g1_i1.p2 TRINITY_DN11984_c0_g1~~TRINITY_DN11984_c0_g1_i1.p2  ORF type:complete len:102 (+),score=1.24 TRINITY_DN11984_c0_g1_i1:34-339(+)
MKTNQKIVEVYIGNKERLAASAFREYPWPPLLQSLATNEWYGRAVTRPLKCKGTVEVQRHSSMIMPTHAHKQHQCVHFEWKYTRALAPKEAAGKGVMPKAE